MRIIITGSTCQIGRRLVERLKSEGHEITSLEGRQSRTWRIGEAIPPDFPADALIHLAHDRSHSFQESRENALVLCKSIEGKKVFLSSLSAHSKSISNYGKSKYETEMVFSEFGGVSLRAGVVYGNEMSGIFQQIQNLILSSRLIPLPNLGNFLVFTTHIDDLINEIIDALESTSPKVVLAANPNPITFGKLCKLLSLELDLKRYFIPVPNQPFERIVRIIAKFFPKIYALDSLLSINPQASCMELSELAFPKNNFRSYHTQGY
jgi:nucleoside-diphosphate-sugar epimerase